MAIFLQKMLSYKPPLSPVSISEYISTYMLHLWKYHRPCILQATQETSVISAGSWLIILSQYFLHGQEGRKEEREGEGGKPLFSTPSPTHPKDILEF